MNLFIYKLGTALKGSSVPGKEVIRGLDITKAITPVTPPSEVPSGSVVINWGTSKYPLWLMGRDTDEVTVLNHPNVIHNSSDKRIMLDLLTKAQLPTLNYIHGWSTDEQLSQFADDPRPVVVRELVASHSGNGIKIIERGDEVPPAKLYTKLEQFSIEQRFFVVGSKVVDVVQKKKMTNAKLEQRGIKFDPIIRTNGNGWVFARTDIMNFGIQVHNLAAKAVDAIGLDFGCVDIGFDQYDQAKIIEVNSAPGLSNPTTVQRFNNALKGMIL